MLIFFLIFPNVFSFSQYFTESYKPDHDNTGIFFVFFPLQKDFDICLGPFFGVFIFLLQKYFDIFHVFLFEAFLCFFDNIYLPFLYIQKKIIKNFLLVTLVLFSISFIRIFFVRIFFIKIFFIRIFFIRVFFIRIFFIRIFFFRIFLSESDEISIL